MNKSEHDYMHEHGIAHTHEHSHESAPACSGCGHDCSSCAGHDPKEELIALMNYMVSHNTAHASELVQLAEKLRELGEGMAYEQLMQAVSDFEKGNLRLTTVLAALKA